MVKCLDLSVFQQDKASYSFSLLFVIHFPLLPCSVCTLRLKKKSIFIHCSHECLWCESFTASDKKWWFFLLLFSFDSCVLLHLAFLISMKCSSFVLIYVLYVTVILFFLCYSDVTASAPCIADPQLVEVTNVRSLYIEICSVEALSFLNASPSFPFKIMKKKKWEGEE